MVLSIDTIGALGRETAPVKDKQTKIHREIGCESGLKELFC